VTERYYTTSAVFLEALAEAGISYIFANLGSDHPGIIEALAQAKAEGRADELPQLIICPHETVALSAAHAYAMVTGEPQAVVVHVDNGGWQGPKFSTLQVHPTGVAAEGRAHHRAGRPLGRRQRAPAARVAGCGPLQLDAEPAGIAVI
jgi:hypothetical protein